MANTSKAKAEARNPTGVNSLRILELLVDHPDGLGLTDMSRSLDMDPAQLHRIANGLRAANYIAKTDATPPRYVLTPRLLRLAARVLDRADLLRTSRPVMVRLRHDSGETVQLAAVADGKPVSVARYLSTRPVSVMTQIGEVWDLEKTAMGRAVRAYSHDGLDESLEEDVLADVRLRGFAIDREEHLRGVVAVASPIFDLHNEVVGAIGVAGPSSRMAQDCDGQEATGRLVVSAATEISKMMGAADGNYPAI